MRRLAALIALLIAAGAFAAAAFASRPVNTAAPSVVGDPVPGMTLTCDPGDWEDIIDGSQPLVAWVVDGTQTTAFAGADSLSLPVTNDMLGKKVSCLAKAANIDGWADPVSSPQVLVVRCTQSTTDSLTAKLNAAKRLEATQAKRLKAAMASYRTLLVTQTKARKAYDKTGPDAAKRKAFLARQLAARTRAKKAIAGAQMAVNSASKAVTTAGEALGACS